MTRIQNFIYSNILHSFISFQTGPLQCLQYCNKIFNKLHFIKHFQKFVQMVQGWTEILHWNSMSWSETSLHLPPKTDHVCLQPWSCYSKYLFFYGNKQYNKFFLKGLKPSRQYIRNKEAGGAYIKSNWVTNLTRISKSPTGLYVNIIVTCHWSWDDTHTCFSVLCCQSMDSLCSIL